MLQPDAVQQAQNQLHSLTHLVSAVLPSMQHADALCCLQPLGEEQMAALLASLESLRVSSSGGSSQATSAATSRSRGTRQTPARSTRKTPARSARKPAPVISSSSDEVRSW